MRQVCSENVNLKFVDEILCLEFLWWKASSWLPEFNNISMVGTSKTSVGGYWFELNKQILISFCSSDKQCVSQASPVLKTEGHNSTLVMSGTTKTLHFIN